MVHHKVHKHNLKKKGWTAKEISKAQAAFTKEHKKNPHVGKWMHNAILLVGAVGIIIFSIYAVPLFYFLPEHLLYVTLILLGLVFGTLLAVMMADLHHLELKHHIFTMFFFTIITSVSFAIVFYNISAVSVGKYEATFNLFIAILSFVVGLLSPHIFHIVTDKRL